eukprot:781124-Lingulodinium_polyedra.AAC.1
MLPCGPPLPPPPPPPPEQTAACDEPTPPNCDEPTPWRCPSPRSRCAVRARGNSSPRRSGHRCRTGAWP